MYHSQQPKSSSLLAQRFNRSATFSSLVLILILNAYAIGAGSGGSAESNEAPYTVAALVERALQRNPHLQAARTVVDAAKGGVLDAGRLQNPSLKLNYASDQTFNNEGESSFGIGFAQKFPITRRLKLERWIAEDSVRLAQAEIAERELILKQEVGHAVYALAATRAERTLRERILDLNREWLRFIDSRIGKGEASEADANRLRLEIYSMEEAHHELTNQGMLQAAELRQLCGLSRAETVELDFKLTLPPELPALQSFERADLERHPSYLVGTLLLATAEKNLFLAKADRWADIEVEVFYKEERGVDAPNGLGRDQLIGFGLSIPLPLHDRGRAAIAQRRSAFARMRWELQATEAKLQSDATVQRVLVENLYAQALEYQNDILPILESNQELMDNAYASGQISLTDLFRTQEQSLHIKSIQLEHLRHLAEAISRWRAATGFQAPYLSNTSSK